MYIQRLIISVRLKKFKSSIRRQLVHRAFHHAGILCHSCGDSQYKELCRTTADLASVFVQCDIYSASDSKAGFQGNECPEPRNWAFIFAQAVVASPSLVFP